MAVLIPQYRERSLQALVVVADPETIAADPKLWRTAVAIGREVYAQSCAACHGASGHGNSSLGVPDLTVPEHLYDLGSVSRIEDIVRHGIRAEDKRGWDLASMPAYASARPYAREAIAPLMPAGIEDLTQFLLRFTAHATNEAAARRGAALFADKGGCWDCHGSDATGDSAIGAPDLTDPIWLYGDGSHDDIYRSISVGRAGYSPAFERHLTAIQLRGVAVYVASLARPARSNSKGGSK